MERTKKGTGTRPAPITVAATVFAVLLFVLVGLFFALPAPQQGSHASSGARPAVVLPAVTPATQLYINRTQNGGGTYIPEWVVLNNSSTLTRIPFSITSGLSGTNCRWVTVVNLTSPAIPKSIFHNVQYRNVTGANGSGALIAGTSVLSFKICGGQAYWVEYQYWTYSVYDFAAPTLGVNGTLLISGFSSWPGTTIPVKNVSANVGKNALAQFIIPTNLTTFTANFPTPVNGPTTCDFTQQVCSFTQWTFVSATDVANVTTSAKVVFSAASGLRVSAAYENWTLGYSNASVGANTQFGAFFAATSSFFQSWFVQFWWLWVVVLLVLIVIALVASRRRRRGRR